MLLLPLTENRIRNLFSSHFFCMSKFFIIISHFHTFCGFCVFVFIRFSFSLIFCQVDLSLSSTEEAAGRLLFSFSRLFWLIRHCFIFIEKYVKLSHLGNQQINVFLSQFAANPINLNWNFKDNFFLWFRLVKWKS